MVRHFLPYDSLNLNTKLSKLSTKPISLWKNPVQKLQKAHCVGSRHRSQKQIVPNFYPSGNKPKKLSYKKSTTQPQNQTNLIVIKKHI